MPLILVGRVIISKQSNSKAVEVVVGNPNPIVAGDCTPGCTPTIQTVFFSSLFGSSPLLINSVGLWMNTIAQGSSLVITFSTSANPTGSLSATFANNLTSDAATFFTGAVPSTTDAAGFTIFSGAGFLYNPSQGDLLMQIVSNGFTGRSAYTNGVNAQRVYSFEQNFPTGSVDAPGYVFNAKFETSAVTSAVPEPATWAFMLLGIGFIGGAIRTSKRRMAQRPAIS